MNFITKVTLIAVLILGSFALKAEEKKYDFTKLDPILINAKGEKAKLDMQGKKYIIVYYSSEWCGTCKEFTPRFVDFYNKNSDNLFEVIFMSLDFSEPKQLAHMQDTSMPWLAVKFSQLKPSGLFDFVGTTMPWISIFTADGKMIAQQNVDLTKHTYQEVLSSVRKIMNMPEQNNVSSEPKEEQNKGCCIKQ